MAPRIKISREDILAAAISIVREQGTEAVNARSVAARLECSIQPVFRTFGTIEELKRAVYQRAEEIYNGEMIKAMAAGGFRGIGRAYIGFARSEKNLFKLLFMTDALRGQNVADIAGTTDGDEEVLALICKQTGLDATKAQRLYTAMWFTTHGIASLLATNASELSDEDAGGILKTVYEGVRKTL
jgi:AcrR family transcriptional regulator